MARTNYLMRIINHTGPLIEKRKWSFMVANQPQNATVDLIKMSALKSFMSASCEHVSRRSTIHENIFRNED